MLGDFVVCQFGANHDVKKSAGGFYQIPPKSLTYLKLGAGRTEKGFSWRETALPETEKGREPKRRIFSNAPSFRGGGSFCFEQNFKGLYKSSWYRTIRGAFVFLTIRKNQHRSRRTHSSGLATTCQLRISFVERFTLLRMFLAFSCTPS